MRLRNVLAMLMALFVMGASSQAAVCELACELQVQVAGCHTAGSTGHGQEMTAMAAGMAHDHCDHGMHVAPVRGMIDSAASCGDGSCSHASLPVLAKGSSSVVHFSAVQWVVVEVVPVALRVTGGGLDVVSRPPLLTSGVDPLLVSLRV